MRKIGLLSIIVPCYNEQEVIRSTHVRLSGILQALITEKKCANYELIYVNDGSKDGTAVILNELFLKDNHVRVITLRRNFGLQGALSAGLCVCEGDAAVTIDADLQDPPEKIGEMVEKYEEEYDLVLGVREDRQTDAYFKRLTAEGFYTSMKILGVEIVHNHGDYRLMARPLVDEFNALTERNRFIRAMILTLDNHYAQVFYKREARTQGVTKFSVAKMLSFSMDGVFSFSFVPLRIISIIGVFSFLLALAGCAYVVAGKLSGNVIPGWASTALPLFLFSGIQLLCLGIIGEYIGRSYIELKNRPLFSIRKESTHS